MLYIVPVPEGGTVMLMYSDLYTLTPQELSECETLSMGFYPLARSPPETDSLQGRLGSIKSSFVRCRWTTSNICGSNKTGYVCGWYHRL